MQDESGKRRVCEKCFKRVIVVTRCDAGRIIFEVIIARIFVFNGNTFEPIAPISQRTKGTAKQVKQVSKPSQIVQTKPKLTGFERAEREIIYHMLQSPEVAVRMESHIEDFHTEEHKGFYMNYTHIMKREMNLQSEHFKLAL